ncbi:hypothetical protein [Streptomyces sp. GS7]|uniref:hypothetical protein n=1 Tax=Streptomyces sp. GS7 TaxID=2692234 RepID=UPI001315BB5D|nr:hypothetical protein [Streptomyces sp. GS7]QHC25927.1 hypothetical protein GR130_35640 [Streptomyces sp. GS7]
MSDDTSGGTSHHTAHHTSHHPSDDASPWQPHRSSGSASSLDTLRRAARWETLAILVALLVLAAVFS